MKEKHVKNFIMTTMNGMVYGLFATLIIGVIVDQIAGIFGLLFYNIDGVEFTIGTPLKALMGVGIGIGIALSLKMDGLKMVVASIMGGIATSFKLQFGVGIVYGLNNDPVTTYLVVIFGILFIKHVMVKKTPIDIILVPLVGVAIAIGLTLAISGPVGFVLTAISNGISDATTLLPIPMTIIISVAMGMLLTSPLSSAAIAIAIHLEGTAGAAAMVGTTVQMIGFAVQSRKDNNVGMVLSVAFGTSMLQFKNILKKPIIWLPTIIVSAILAPIIVLTMGTETSYFGAGMGSSALVGQLQTLSYMGYSLMSWIAVIITIVASALLVFVVDLIFRKFNLIVKGDLAVNNDIS